MDTFLIILGVLGLGAILIAAYVFTVAARNYVSDNRHHDSPSEASSSNSPTLTERSESDRRQIVTIASFPITVNGVLIAVERRLLPDRRRPA